MYIYTKNPYGYFWSGGVDCSVTQEKNIIKKNMLFIKKEKLNTFEKL